MTLEIPDCFDLNCEAIAILDQNRLLLSSWSTIIFLIPFRIHTALVL